MEYTVNFKGAERDEDWAEDITAKLKVYAYEFKNIVNMYYTLEEFITELNANNEYISDLQNEYNDNNKSAFGAYKILYDNLLRRFGIFCELNELHIIITIKKNGNPYKQFKCDHIFTIKSIYNL
jgi:hypothetical protein